MKKQAKSKHKKIITNCGKLKGLIVEKGKNFKECALALDISEFQFRQKINGKADFWVSEAIILGNYLKLTEQEFIAVFLPHMVKNT